MENKIAIRQHILNMMWQVISNFYIDASTKNY